jgi:hypothetical protein
MYSDDRSLKSTKSTEGCPTPELCCGTKSAPTKSEVLHETPFYRQCYFNSTATWLATPAPIKHSSQLNAAWAVSTNDLLACRWGRKAYCLGQDPFTQLCPTASSKSENSAAWRGMVPGSLAKPTRFCSTWPAHPPSIKEGTMPFSWLNNPLRSGTRLRPVLAVQCPP